MEQLDGDVFMLGGDGDGHTDAQREQRGVVLQVVPPLDVGPTRGPARPHELLHGPDPEVGVLLVSIEVDAMGQEVEQRVRCAPQRVMCILERLGVTGGWRLRPFGEGVLDPPNLGVDEVAKFDVPHGVWECAFEE